MPKQQTSDVLARHETWDPPTLLTSGKIADELGVPVQRVLHILRTRPHIQPLAFAGNTRLYNRELMAMVRHEVNKIDARRAP